jgi:hypothetical protein
VTDPPTPPIATAINEANQAHAAAYGALVILLIDKGIITREEYDRAYIQAQHSLSQEFARKRDKVKEKDNGI